MAITTPYEIGERVWATVGPSGFARPGVVVGVTTLNGGDVPYPYDRTYSVHFDGDDGPSGPCVIHRAERGREDTSPTTGTAA